MISSLTRPDYRLTINPVVFMPGCRGGLLFSRLQFCVSGNIQSPHVIKSQSYRRLKSSPPLQLEKDSCAFTLIELLVVIGIMAMLLAFVVPAVVPLLRSTNINGSAAMVTDELNFARQFALTQNRDVEVRFYKLPSKADPNDLQFRAFRTFSALGNNTTRTALSNVKYLPEPAIISGTTDKSGNVLSTLLDKTNRPVLGNGNENLPSAPNTPFISFLFRATGGTNLTPVDPPGGNWYLTIYLENSPKDATTGIPNNYFTAQVDAVTGRVRTYRP